MRLSFIRIPWRLLVLWLVCALLAVSSAGCQPSLVPAQQGLMMRDVELPVRQLVYPSGLRVVAERDARMPIVGLFLVVGSGGSSDPIGKEGLAHYIEHLTFRSRPFSKSSFRRLLERGGAGEWNAITGLDATTYYEVGSSSSLPDLLRLEGARMFAPVANLTPDTFAVELDVVRNELRERNETGFVGEVLSALQKAVFPPGYAYARPIMGTHESLTSIQVDDVKAFLRDHYQPSNMTLAIVGNVDLPSLDALLTQALPSELLNARGSKPSAPLPARAPEPPNPPPNPPAVPPDPEQFFSRQEAAVATPEIWIGWSLPRAFDADARLAEIVTQRASYALPSASHEDLDIVGVNTELVPGKDASMLVARVLLREGSHPEKSLNHVLNRIGATWSYGGRGFYPDQAFKSQQRYSVVDQLLETENLVEHGIMRAQTTHFTQDPRTYMRGFKRIIELDRTQLTEYTERYLQRDRARAVLFMPSPGGVRSTVRPVGAHQLGDDDPVPLNVSEARLGALAPSPDASSYRRTVLPNGLEVIIGPRDGVPSAFVGVLVHGGFGTAKDPGAARIATMLSSSTQVWHEDPEVFGGHERTLFTRDERVYSLQGAAGNVGMMIKILADTVRSPHVERGHWQDIERRFIEYQKVAERKPETVAERSFLANLFPGHPYGRSITAEAISHSSEGAAQDWIDETHTPSNSTLVIVGEVDPEFVEKIVREKFGDWGHSTTPPSPPPAYEPKIGGGIKVLVSERPGATQTQIRLGCALPAANNAMQYASYEVSAHLAEGRVEEVLRQTLGVTYGIHGFVQTFAGGTTYLEIDGAVERDKLGVSLSTLRDTLKSLADAPVSAKDLAWAKLWVARTYTTAYVTNRGLASALMRAENLGYGVDSVDGEASRIASTNPTTAQNDIRACVNAGLVLSLVGDAQAIRAARSEAGL